MTTTCYRVQPKGKELADHRSETSNGEADRGCHVFGSVSEMCGGLLGWTKQTWKPEIVTIECDEKALADNGDYEGYVLIGNRGTIVARKSFASWGKLIEWAKQFPEAI